MKVFFLLLFSLWIPSLTASTGVRPLPLYMDNGRDQTTMDLLHDETEKKEVKEQMLGFMDIPFKPRGYRGTDGPTEIESTNYLLKAFKSIEHEGDKRRLKRYTLSDWNTYDERKVFKDSDIVMSFKCRKVFKPPKRNGNVFDFDLRGVPNRDGNAVISAGFRLYQNGEFTTKCNYTQEYIIRIFNVLNTPSGGALQHIGSANITKDYVGWVQVNITGFFAQWPRHLMTDFDGLYLSAHPKGSKRDIEPESLGIVTQHGHSKTPFVIGFWTSDNDLITKRVPRGIPLGRRKTLKSDYSLMMRDLYKNKDSDGGTRSCRLQNLYISFKDLQWNDWIIAPEGYEAFFCGGDCNFPLNGNMNATNHAIVQTLVHLIHPAKYPKPCCAATKLTPISVLYHFFDSNVVLKKYKKMIARGCGCL